MNIARKLSLVAVALTASLWGLSDQSRAQLPPQPPAPEEQGRGLPGEGREPQAEQSAESSTPSVNQAPVVETESLSQIEKHLRELEQLKTSKADAALEIGPVAVPFAYLTGGSLVLALLSLATGITAHLQLRRSHQSLKRQTDSLRTQLNTMEMQVEQDRVVNRTRPTPSATAQLFSTSPPPTTNPRPTPMSATPAATSPMPTPAAAPAQSPAPAPISKAGLIAALNNGERQQLRDAAKAELNITSESENAIATGRATATELEEVPGGGSYWLISLNQQYWLFPTDRTLKGFAAAQPSKGLFTYEKQTISKAQLIEPALLEYTGSTWSVKTLGRIGTP